MSDKIKYLTDEELQAKLEELKKALTEATGVVPEIFRMRANFEPERCRRTFLVGILNQSFEIRETHSGEFWWR